MKEKRRLLALPYAIFLVLFVLLPLLVVCYYAFTDANGAVSFANFIAFFKNPKMIGTLLYSFGIALLTTLICLLIAYPTAYIIAKGPFRNRQALLIVMIIPMWINFTLRITAMKEVLSAVEGNLALYPFLNTIICMVYDFLPFMIMPIYTSISELDDQMWEAAADLGAKKITALKKIIIPLTLPGIMSGVTMVFLPAMTNYVVLDLVHNSTYIMGSLIGSYCNAYDWNNGSVISVILLILILLMSALGNSASDQVSLGGSVGAGNKVRSRISALSADPRIGGGNE